MANLIADVKIEITNAINLAAKKAFDGTELAPFTVEATTDASHGDFAANAAMVWARAFRKAPRMIAETLKENISLEGTYIDRLEIAGPGFINFFLSDRYYADIVADVTENRENYGKSDCSTLAVVIFLLYTLIGISNYGIIRLILGD